MIGLTLAMATLFFLLASGFYSGTEMGVYCVNRVRLRLRYEQQPDVTSRSLHRLMQRRDETVLAILLGTNLANYLLTVAASEWLTHTGGIRPAEVAYYCAAILSPAVFVLGGLRFIAESAGAGVHDRAARLLIDHHQRLAQSEKVHDAPDTHDP